MKNGLTLLLAGLILTVGCAPARQTETKLPDFPVEPMMPAGQSY